MEYIGLEGPMAVEGTDPVMVAAMPSMLQAKNLLQVPGIVHGFTTRVIPIPYHSGEPPSSGVTRDWSTLRSALDAPDYDVAVVSQVHGDRIVELAPGPLDTPIGQGDAMFCDRPGVLLCIRVADCVPILLAAPGAVMAVHAGWRGTAANIVGRAVELLLRKTGAKAEQLVATIGPCIGPCCYETGPEVVTSIARTVETEHFLIETPGAAPKVDLAQANRRQLMAAGLQKIELLGCCTRCDPRFHSYRRDAGHHGRQAGVIGMRP